MTRRQRRALDFIEDFIGRNGYSPSMEEIAAALEIKAKSDAQSVVVALKRRGYLDYVPRRPRSISVRGRGDAVFSAAEGLLETITYESRDEDVAFVSAFALEALAIAVKENRLGKAPASDAQASTANFPLGSTQ